MKKLWNHNVMKKKVKLNLNKCKVKCKGGNPNEASPGWAPSGLLSFQSEAVRLYQFHKYISSAHKASKSNYGIIRTREDRHKESVCDTGKSTINLCWQIHDKAVPGYWGSSGPSHPEQECRRGEKGGENPRGVKKVMKEQLDNSEWRWL